MLSIGKIALGQHRYYEQQVAQGGDDYYSGRGEAPGEWVGAGADALGLSGRVSAEQFNALIAGLDPRDPSVRLRASAQEPKVAAFDLTFSAPKSVSVLFAVAPEQVSGALVACHEEAVRAALGYLEDTAVMVRRGHGGERVEPAGGLIAAAYRHRMSRALDPQLHTHVVAANLARGADGRFTALHGAPLYRAAKTAGFLYQAHLRALVSERLGLEWGAVHNGAAELAARAAAGDRAVLQAPSRDAARGARRAGSAWARRRRRRARRSRPASASSTGSTPTPGARRCGREPASSARRRRDRRAAARPARERAVDGLAKRERGGRATPRRTPRGRRGSDRAPNTFDERAVLREFAAAAAQGLAVERGARPGRAVRRARRRARDQPR